MPEFDDWELLADAMPKGALIDLRGARDEGGDEEGEAGQTPDAHDDDASGDLVSPKKAGAKAAGKAAAPRGEAESEDEDDPEASSEKKLSPDEGKRQGRDAGRRPERGARETKARTETPSVFRNVEADKVPEEYRGYKYVALDPETQKPLVRFKDDEAVYKGVLERESFIRKQKADHAADLAKRDEALQEANRRLSFYERRVPKETLRERLVDERLPEEFQGKTEADIRASIEEELEKADILDPDELQQRRDELLVDRLGAYRAARREAEQRADAEIANPTSVEDERAQQFAEKLQEAIPFAQKLFDAETLGIDGAAEEALLGEVMAEMTFGEGQTPVQAAQVLAAVFGERMAEAVRDGVLYRLSQKREALLEKELAGARKSGPRSLRDAPPPSKIKKLAGYSGAKVMEMAEEGF